jgi:hypothetical protein
MPFWVLAHLLTKRLFIKQRRLVIGPVEDEEKTRKTEVKNRKTVWTTT